MDFLTTEEIEKIRDTDFKNESINRIRDLFIFQASSGLSYCDMFTLVPEDFQMNQDGHMYIHKRRAKTNIFFTSVILPDGEDIVEKYDFKLPVISNNKYNAYLKFIKDICEIDKPLHTHIARHTYATRCINAGIRLEVVQKLMGHTTTRQCLHYAKLVEKNIVDEVQDAFAITGKGK
ncbi:MAG: integrase catalytic domain-containing protein [Alistipes sp.]|nr:integrase catalytic domain-containing protein [Candidatus Alistipes equi]